MSYFDAFLYGMVQGLTEYLPVSSSAHLILLPKFLGQADPGLSFDVVLHLGTLIATLVYFRNDWLAFFLSLRRNAWGANGNSAVNLVLVTLPAVIVGLLFRHQIEDQLRQNWIQATALIVGGFGLWAADHFAHGRRSMGIQLILVTKMKALGVGLFQTLALIPGMSRSGSTMMGGRILGLNRETTAKFSFLASTPITAAALALELMKWLKAMAAGTETVAIGPLLVAVATSFVFGWLAIDQLLKLVSRIGFGVFAIYRVVLAIVVLKVLGA